MLLAIAIINSPKKALKHRATQKPRLFSELIQFSTLLYIYTGARYRAAHNKIFDPSPSLCTNTKTPAKR